METKFRKKVYWDADEEQMLSEIESRIETIGIEGVLNCVVKAFKNAARDCRVDGDHGGRALFLHTAKLLQKII